MSFDDADPPAGKAVPPPPLTLSQRVGVWLLRKLPRETVEATALYQSDNDEFGEGLRRRGLPGWLRSYIFPHAALSRYRRLEEWSWRIESTRLQNLAWLLRTKCEESTVAARLSARMGFGITCLAGTATLGGLGAAYRGWTKVVGLVGHEPKTGLSVVPDHLWVIVVATTGVLLLIAGASALLFRVAAQFYDRSLGHTRDAGFTRQIETAIRVILSLEPNAHDGINDGLSVLAVRLLQRGEEPSSGRQVPDDLSTIPETVKELLDLLVKMRSVANER